MHLEQPNSYYLILHFLKNSVISFIYDYMLWITSVINWYGC